MILRTQIEWLEPKQLSEEEQAKLDYLGKHYVPDDEEIYTEVLKNALIDTSDNKLYIELDSTSVAMSNLLSAIYVVKGNGEVQRNEEKLYIKSTLDEIYENLTNKNK